MTFEEKIGELALVPASPGVFDVFLDGEKVFAKSDSGKFPESKELKQLIRNKIDPDMELGHSDN